MLRTDQASLTWLLPIKTREGLVPRWIERLKEDDFTIKQRKGRLHNNLDALSRRCCEIECMQCHQAEEKEHILLYIELPVQH